MFDPLSAYVDVFLLVLSSGGGGEGGVSAPGTGPDFVPLRDEEAPVCAAHVRGPALQRADESVREDAPYCQKGATTYVTLQHKTSLKSLGDICSNSQKYIVWDKIIDFSFMQKNH